jgi:glycosyltransferase involved in cell wall biosynthesis
MFSVVIPSYNHEKFLEEAIASAMTENLVSEILVGDDGSRDRSVAMIEKLARIYPRKIRNLTQYPTCNIGAHAMLNMLVSHANARWIAVLNSDDRFASGRFAAIKNRLRVSKFDFCFGNISIIDDDSVVIGRKRAFVDPQFPFPKAERNMGAGAEELLSRLMCQNYIATTSNMVFTKDLWEKIGGFRDYRYVHDWDFALRAMSQGSPEYINEYMTCYRVHGSNTISESRASQDEEVRRMFSALREVLGDKVFQDNKAFIAANGYL